VITPSAPMAGISRSVVLSPDEKVRLELEPHSSAVVVEMDGLVFRDAATEGTVDISYRRNAGLVVRFDPQRYQERNQLKMTLLDLPFLPEQLRELLPDGAQRSHDHDFPPRC